MKPGKVLIGLAMLAVAACAEPPPPPPPPPPPTIINVAVSAGADINPNAAGRPSPTVVRVYYLVSEKAFQEADFFQLFDQESGTLGADLAARDEITISPGETKAVDREVRSDVRFLGVAVSYREIDSAVWRGVVSVPQNQTTIVLADLRANAVSLSTAPAE